MKRIGFVGTGVISEAITAAGWLTEKGLPPDQADTYLRQFFPA